MSVDSEKLSQADAGETATPPATAEAAEMLGRLVAFEQAVVTGTIKALPPVREQLKGYLEDRGL